MHLLNRSTVQTPACLDPTDPPRHFSNLQGPEKSEVRAALLDIQRGCCAYCERRTGLAHDEGHVEHFRNQADHPHLETDWDNLFWSCNDEKTCGKHKDKCDRCPPSPKRSFNHDDIIKPCTDDPDHFMVFISDGTITSRIGISESDLHRYNETLRVFQLADSPFLCQSREDAVKPFIGALDALRSVGAELFCKYIDGEIARLDSAPYCTAIRHFLESSRP
jgi:uncharacterized protein (TIGR02646 family)